MQDTKARFLKTGDHNSNHAHFIKNLVYSVKLDKDWFDSEKMRVPDSFTKYEAFKEYYDELIAFMLTEGEDYTAPLMVNAFGTEGGGNADKDEYWDYLLLWLHDHSEVAWAYDSRVDY